MYLARFALDDAAYIQGVARIEYARCESARDLDLLRRHVHGCVAALLASGGSHYAFRVCLTESGALSSTYLVLAQAHGEPALRASLGSFCRLEASSRATVEFPLVRQQFDRLVADFPTYQALIQPSRQQAHNAALTCDFRVGHALQAMFEAAWLASVPIGYQLQTAEVEIPRGTVRAALRNLEVLENTPGCPSDLLAFQREITSKLTGPIVLCEELLGAQSERDTQWVRNFVKRRFDDDYGRYRVLAPVIDFKQHDLAESLETGLIHSVDGGSSFDEICAASITEQQRTKLLQWVPESTTLFNLPSPPLPRDPPLEEIANRPASRPAPDSAYLFVSYARKDLDRVRVTIQEIERCGHRVWFDEYIPGGSEWDSVLEERILASHAVLIFLSNHAVQSRYVRREVKFADAIGKKILCIKLEETKLEHGLAMLLGSTQMMMANMLELGRRLREALQEDERCEFR